MVWTTQLANTILHGLLESLFTIDQEFFPKRINFYGKDLQLYLVFRSFRRGSDSHALSEDVSELDVNVVNWWAKKEKAKGKKIALKNMMGYYAQLDIMLNCFLRYTPSCHVRVLTPWA
jgi:hypothetical protein